MSNAAEKRRNIARLVTIREPVLRPLLADKMQRKTRKAFVNVFQKGALAATDNKYALNYAQVVQFLQHDMVNSDEPITFNDIPDCVRDHVG
ncbi:MAG: hypothetical protein ACFB2Z_03515 [Maricaulaceae bacterium]